VRIESWSENNMVESKPPQQRTKKEIYLTKTPFS